VRARNELMVGGAILFTIIVGVVGTLWLQRSSFGRPTVPVDVLLERVGQLSEGNVVTYRGVRIGQVALISVEPGGQVVRVTLQLREEVELPDDAGVVLGPESLFGDWQAEVVSRESFPRYDFHDVPEGVGPNVLGGYALPEITRLTASAEQISDNLADLTNRLELAFNQETADNLATAIANIEDITREVQTLVRQQGEAAARITANADSALTEVVLAASAARRSFERIDEVLTDAQADSLLIDMRAAAAGLRKLTEDLSEEEQGVLATLERADSALTRIDRIAATVESGEGSLGRLLADSTFAVRAESVLLSLDLLLQDLRDNPRRYVRLSIF